MVGVYENGILIESFSSSKKSSEALPLIFDKIIKNYVINTLFYTRGPGSFMAIKVSYIFLKSLSIAKKIELFACEGFSFNNNLPIKANGTRYFMKENGKISIIKIDKPDFESRFTLPVKIDRSIFSSDIEPLYILPAV